MVEGQDAFLELEYGVGCRQHRVRVGAHHVQAGMTEVGEVVAVAEDANLQHTMLEVVAAGVNGRKDGALCPRIGMLDHQHWARALAQQVPVFRSE
ncbi:hypothetical protein D3C76_950320 [compost metagenome]